MLLGCDCCEEVLVAEEMVLRREGDCCDETEPVEMRREAVSEDADVDRDGWDETETMECRREMVGAGCCWELLAVASSSSSDESPSK